LKRTGEERVGEREGQRERGRGKGGEERGTYQLTRQNYDRCFFHPAIPTEDGFFFSSTTEPNAVKIVQGVAAGFSLQSQNQTRCKLYRELQ
jgi:hypothetical protein